MFIFYQPEVSDGHHFLTEEESKHCVKVLRHQPGDHIRVQDGHGNLFDARITSAHSKKCEFEVIHTEFQPPPPFSIHIALAPTKNIDRTEWFVEKAVEIGVQQISFIHCKNSERKVLKTDRLERKALSAMKQSQHLYLPAVHDIMPFEQFVRSAKEEEKYIAHVDFTNPRKLHQVATPGQQYCLLIGPEGDFTENELRIALDYGFQKVSLGNSRLRTETAGIVGCQTLQLVNDL